MKNYSRIPTTLSAIQLSLHTSALRNTSADEKFLRNFNSMLDRQTYYLNIKIVRVITKPFTLVNVYDLI